MIFDCSHVIRITEQCEQKVNIQVCSQGEGGGHPPPQREKVGVRETLKYAIKFSTKLAVLNFSKILRLN